MNKYFLSETLAATTPTDNEIDAGLNIIAIIVPILLTVILSAVIVFFLLHFWRRVTPEGNFAVRF